MDTKKMLKFLQWVSAVLQGFFILQAMLITVVFFFEVSGKSIIGSYLLGEALIEIPGEYYSITSKSLKGEGIILEQVKGKVMLENPSDFGEYPQRPSVHWMLLNYAIATCAFFICGFFRKFFKNIREGEAFTLGSIQKLHKIGALVIGMSLVGAIESSWTNYRNANFLENTIEATGLALDFRTSSSGGGFKIGGSLDKDEFLIVVLGNAGFEISEGNFYFKLPISGILAGLILLGIGELFRQGLALKEENDLKV